MNSLNTSDSQTFEWIKVAGHCEQHGAFEKVLPSSYKGAATCDVCNEEKRTQEKAQELAARIEKQRLDELEWFASNARIPSRFRAVGFEDFRADTERQRRARDVVAAYADAVVRKEHRGSWLVLIGPPGTGKTMLAAAACNAVAAKTCKARYVRFPDLIADVRGSYAKDADYSELDVFEDLAQQRLLALDEVIGASEHGMRLLFEVIDFRYRERRPLILASNHTREELEAIIGDRAADRLAEQAVFVACDWPSYRRRKH
jgi:DNA replication protein DnaC